MDARNTQVPDSIPVADVLFDLLAQTVGHGVGSQAGHNLAGRDAANALFIFAINVCAFKEVIKGQVGFF